jgi:hypothetical protein
MAVVDRLVEANSKMPNDGKNPARLSIDILTPRG